MEGDVNTLSPNTRAAAVKRFLSGRPPKATELILTVSAAGGGTTVMLGSWSAEEATPVLALEVLAMLAEHATEIASRVVGMLIWRDEKEKSLGAKVVNASPRDLAPAGDSLASSPDQLTGDATSLTVQAQKHLEVMQRMMLTSLGGVIQQSRQLAEHAMELCDTLAQSKADAEARAEKVAHERDALLREREIMMEQQDAGGDEQVNASQAQIMRLIEPVLPALIAKFLAGGGGSGGGAPPVT